MASLESGIKSGVTGKQDLCDFVRRLILEDEEIQSKLFFTVSEINKNHLEKASKILQPKDHDKLPALPKYSKQRVLKKGSKKTKFPFAQGEEHPSGFQHQFSFKQQVFLVDEKSLANMMDETPYYAYVLGDGAIKAD